MYSTGNSIQYSVMDKWTKNLKKEWIYRRTTDPLCCTPETNTILEIKYAPIIFKIKKKSTDSRLEMASHLIFILICLSMD